jgi:hypothetical protein
MIIATSLTSSISHVFMGNLLKVETSCGRLSIPLLQVSRLQAVVAEAANIAQMKVSWSAPVDGNDLDAQFTEMSLWIGRLAETLERQQAECDAYKVSCCMSALRFSI